MKRKSVISNDLKVVENAETEVGVLTQELIAQIDKVNDIVKRLVTQTREVGKQ